MAAFATVTELEEFMGSGVLGSRGAVMLEYASAEIRGYVGQDMDAFAGRQEEHAADATKQLLYLSELPVAGVTEVTVDGAVITDFVWSRWGSLRYEDWSAWEDGPIVITYDSGWDVDSDEMSKVKTICLEVAARALGGPQDGSFAAFGSEVAELRGAAPAIFLTDGEKHDLDRFCRVAVG